LRSSVAIVKAARLSESVMTVMLAAAFVTLDDLRHQAALEAVWGHRPPNDAGEHPSRGSWWASSLAVFVSALYTEVIGIHALLR
jgi:hypothetical protein